MTTVEKKKLTVLLDAEVYEGMRRKAGERGIGAYLSACMRPFVVEDDLRAGYRAMAADAEREAQAGEWIEGGVEVPEGEGVWRF